MCIIRYAAGYASFASLKKYEKSSLGSAVQCIECLTNMAICGKETDFLKYTRAWTEEVNRGGLIEVNDKCIHAIQRNLQNNLQTHLQLTMVSDRDSTKEKLVLFVVQNRNIQLYWHNLSVDINDENYSQNLLREIIELWLNIRGYSIAGQWLEYYKNSTAKIPGKVSHLESNSKRSDALVTISAYILGLGGIKILMMVWY